MTAPWIYFIQIEGLAKEQATPGTVRRYRIAQSPMDTDADSVVKPWLIHIPSEIGWQIDPISGTVDLGGAEFLIARNATTIKWFHTLNATPVATLATAVNAAATTLQFAAGDTGLEGTLVHMGRECAYLHTETGAGQPGEYTSCLRGRALTQATAHGVLTVNDTDVWAAEDNPFRKLRRVILMRTRRDGTYASGETVPGGEYVLRDIAVRNGGFVITCDSYMAYLESRTFLDSRWQLSERAPFLVTGQYINDGEYKLTTQISTASANAPHSALMAFDDTAAIVPAWYGDTVLYNGAVTLRSTGVVEISPRGERAVTSDTWRPASVAGSVPIRVDPDWPDSIHEVFVTNPQAPSNSASPSTDTLPYRSHVCEFAQQVLQTTKRGDNNNSGTGINSYDIGDGNSSQLARLGIGVPADMIDSASFATVTALKPNATMPALWLGMKNEPVDALPLLREALLVFGIYLAPTSVGLLGAIALQDAIDYSTSTTAITEADILNPGITQESGITQAISTVEVEYAALPGKKSSNAVVTIPQITRRNAGQASTMSLKALGIRDQSKAEDAGLRFVDLFQLGMPMFKMTVRRTVNPAPGSMVLLTSALAVGNGTMGITNALCQVLGKRHSLQDATNSLVLAWVGMRYNRPGMYAPSAEVASRSLAVLTMVANTFTRSSGTSTGGHFDDDASSFRVGDRVALKSGTDLTAVWGSRYITDITGNDITLDADPGSATAGDILVLGTYNNYQDSTTLKEFAYYGDDADDSLGSGAADLYEYVT